MTTSPPQAAEAEKAVLGCVLIDPESYHELMATGLVANDFYLIKHRWVWEAIGVLARAVPPVGVDLLTVSEVLASYGQLGEAGGTAYLTDLINTVPTAQHAADYAGLVIKQARRRALLQAAHDLVVGASDETLEPQAVATSLINRLSPIARPPTRHGGFMADLVGPAIDRLAHMAETPEAFPVLTTGINRWDDLVQGLFKTNYELIAGKPGAGKTALMLQIAAANAADCTLAGISKPARHVAYFSLEMSIDELMGRLMSRHGVIEVQKFRRAQFSTPEWERLYQIEGPLGAYQLYLDDTASLTLAQLESTCRWLVGEWGLDLVIIDYLQLMAGSGGENRNAQLSAISQGIRGLAKDLDVCVVAGSQFSRKSDSRADQRPILSDLRDSGSLEQDATGVTFIHPDPDQKDAATIIVAKQRNGPIGELPVVFDKPFSRFKSAEIVHFNLDSL